MNLEIIQFDFDPSTRTIRGRLVGFAAYLLPRQTQIERLAQWHVYKLFGPLPTPAEYCVTYRTSHVPCDLNISNLVNERAKKIAKHASLKDNNWEFRYGISFVTPVPIAIVLLNNISWELLQEYLNRFWMTKAVLVSTAWRKKPTLKPLPDLDW